MPANDGLGLHDDEDVAPPRPRAAQGSPEDSVQPIEVGPGLLPFEDGDLLSESQNFQRKVTPTAEEYAHDSEDRKDGLDQELTVVT